MWFVVSNIPPITQTKKSRDSNERGRRKTKMMKINAIRKRKKISAQKKSVKNFFQKKTNKLKVVNISDDETQQNVDETQENVEEEN